MKLSSGMPARSLIAALLAGACHVLLPPVLFALDPVRTTSQYVLQHWQTEQGLPQNSVTTILQDRSGYLWLGTQEGLARFDGMRFAVFDRSNTPQLRHNGILSLLQDSAGILWIGTYDGLHRLQDGHLTHAGMEGHAVQALQHDENGALWVGTDHGLFRKQGDLFEKLLPNSPIGDSPIYALQTASDGPLWIGTSRGLFTYSGDTLKKRYADVSVRALYEDQRKDIWAGTETGLLRLSGETTDRFTKTEGLSNDSVWAITEDRDGNLWIGSYGGGLNRYASGKFSALLPSDGLTSEIVWALEEDREGNLWAGTYGGGLNQLRDGKLTTFTTREGLSHNVIHSIYEDAKGSLWIASNSGVDRFFANELVHYGPAEGLSNLILTVGEDAEGSIWVGTEGAGAFRLQNRKWTNFTTTHGLFSNDIRCIFLSKNKTLWIGTYGGGASSWQKDRFISFTTREGLAHNVVHAIAEDENGALWFGTNGGLSRYDGKNFHNLTTEHGLSKNLVLSIYVDAQKIMWVGTYGGGLNRIEGSKVHVFTRANGLYDDAVAQILEDSKGNLWMTSNKGIFHVRKSELNDVASGKKTSVKSTGYGTRDGMKSAECNGGSQPAGWRTRQGTMWFPTIEGAVMVDPERIPVNRMPPPVFIEKMLADHREVRLNTDSRGMDVQPGKGALEFHYTALSFTNPAGIRFQYRLSGFETEWNDAHDRRTAYYTNIAPGAYSFEARAANSDGVWNETGAVVSFVLQPHFYQTWWFYLSCGFVVLFLAYGAHRMRLRKLHQQMQFHFAAVLQERSRIAREIHDTLAQGLAGIALRLETCNQLLPEAPATVKQQILTARELATQTVKESRRLVENLRPLELQSLDLAAAIRTMTMRVASDGNTVVRCEINGDFSNLREAVEHNVLRIFQEAINNAVQHANAETIDVTLTRNSEYLTLTVQDDGKGFEPATAAQKPRHYGLSGMQERAGEVGGKLDVQSLPGKGTRLTVSVPL